MGPGVNLTRVAAAAALVLAALAVLPAAWTPAASAAHVGAAQLGAVGVLYDRSYKVDLLERLPSPPELVIFGGSRAQRFEPSVAEKLTGLPAFNFAVQNSRPEDVYAMARLLFWRAPSVKLRCIWALQATTLADSPLHPGLLAEPRLTQFLPDYLVAGQRKVSVSSEGREMQSVDEYSARGQLLHNGYDLRLERGVSFESTLLGYLSEMVPRAGSAAPYAQTRAKQYFERTLELFNLHGVEPVLVIMPYHPDALAAFRAAGWDAKEAAFKSYLESLQGRYSFRLLDYTDLAAFHGSADEFYDGAHVTAVNARRILVQAVKDAPHAFR